MSLNEPEEIVPMDTPNDVVDSSSGETSNKIAFSSVKSNMNNSTDFKDISLIRAIEIGKGVMMVPKECIRMSRHKPGFFIRAWVERIFYSLFLLCIGCLTKTDVRKGILPKYDSFPLNWTPPPVFCNYNGEFASKFDLVLIFCVGLRPTHLS